MPCGPCAPCPNCGHKKGGHRLAMNGCVVEGCGCSTTNPPKVVDNEN